LINYVDKCGFRSQSMADLNTYEASTLELLGLGSYTNFDLCYHKTLNRYVVLKSSILWSENVSKEAKILAQLKHDNVVGFLGVTNWEGRFGIIMEFLPCGNLDNLLFKDCEISLPWIIRRRFFLEIANALDYLHDHDTHRTYVHGNLKPQNILLTDSLNIKLSDFGDCTKSLLENAIENNTYTNLHGNIQDDESFEVIQHKHTLYTAPEYLKTPTTDKCSSMDVYSYGMVGYEIITRKAIFGGDQVTYKNLLLSIESEGRKPNQNIFGKVFLTLVKDLEDLNMFLELKEIVQKCWIFLPFDRPKISEVTKKLNDSTWLKKMYSHDVDAEANRLIVSRKLNFQLPISEQTTSLLTKTKVNYT